MNSRASEDSLAELHGLLANHFKAKLLSGDISPSELSAARQFLKDNNIDCVGGKNQDMEDLTRLLPSFDDDLDNDVGDSLLN